MSYIRRISVDIINYLETNLLPPHKRQRKRIAFLSGLLSPLAEASGAFITWRDDIIIRASVTGQIASLQWYLNEVLDPSLRRILIISGTIVGNPLSLRTEAGSHFQMSLRSEVGTAEGMVLRGENVTSLPLDFRIAAPASVDQGQVKSITDTYKQSGKLYDIITF